MPDQETGKNTRAMCKAGCIGCGICKKQTELFSVVNFNARMDYENYQPTEQSETAMAKCPTGVIVYRGKSAPPPRQPKQKPTFGGTILLSLSLKSQDRNTENFDG